MHAEKTTILVVDDQIRSRRVIVQLLEPLGFEIVEADDGAEAIRILESKTPDLMLLDVMMPDMNGYEVCRRARAIKHCAEIPIIMTTALDDRQAKLEGLEAGADEFLTKPVDRLELRSRVQLAARLNRFRKISDERNRLALLFNKAPHAIFLLGDGRKVTSANEAAGTMFGPIVDGPLDSIVDTESTDRFLAAYELVLSGRRESQDLQAECNGREGVFTAAITVADFSTKSECSVQVHVRNIGRQGELENELLRSQRLQGVGAVATGIAHDMINILTPISITMQALKALVKNDQEQELVDCMADAATRGIGMLDQMLGYAKSTDRSQGKLQVDHVVEEIGRIVRPVVPKQVRFSTHVGQERGFVNGDATQVHQICLNLSLNAIEAVGNRGQVDISCAKVVVDELSAAAVEGAYPGCFIKIQVTDDGEGIAPKIRPDIFKPFSTTKAKGGGLGLYTVAKITERLGGFLQVEEPPKGGAAIAVYLPSADPLTTEEKPKPLCPIRGEDRLVLLHERNSEMRAALKFNLEKHGLPVKEAEDGADLLHQFMVNGSSVGLLICSSTGDIDGTEIIRVCRKSRPDVPAILLASEPSMEPAFAAASKTVLLTKPFTATEFRNALQHALEEQVPKP